MLPRADYSLQPQRRLSWPRALTGKRQPGEGRLGVGVTPSIGGCLGLLSGSPFNLSFPYICLSSCRHNNGSGSALPWGAMTMTLLAWALQRRQVECWPRRPPACSSPGPHLLSLPAPALCADGAQGPGARSSLASPLPSSQPGVRLVLFRPRGVWSGGFPPTQPSRPPQDQTLKMKPSRPLILLRGVALG